VSCYINVIYTLPFCYNNVIKALSTCYHFVIIGIWLLSVYVNSNTYQEILQVCCIFICFLCLGISYPADELSALLKIERTPGSFMSGSWGTLYMVSFLKNKL
jgi:hypothetical protein